MDERALRLVNGELVDELAVQLQDLRLQREDLLEARPARAGIVDRDQGATPPKAIDGASGRGEIMDFPMRRQFEDDPAQNLVRGAVIVVDASLDLLDVGEAVARDDKARVASWIAAGLLAKPTLETIAAWEKATGPAWTALVVQPFVLLREGLTAESN